MGSYQLTPAELEQLNAWGFDLTEIDRANVIAYSFGDWADPNHSVGPFEFGGWGIKPSYLNENGENTSKENGVLTLFVMPESEGRKIEQRKIEIIEGFVLAYTDALTGYFESRYNRSKEKSRLVQKELQQLEKLLFEWKENVRYGAYGDTLWL